MKIKDLINALNNGVKLGYIKEDQEVLVFNYETSSLDCLDEINADDNGNVILYVGEGEQND